MADATQAGKDLNLVAGADGSGAGDIVFKTGGSIERGRINANGNGTGILQIWPLSAGLLRMPNQPQTGAPLTSWPSGHGWAGAGTGGTVSDDTLDYVVGLQSLKIVTAGNNAVVEANKASGLAWNIASFAGGSGGRLRLALKCDNWTAFIANGGGCSLYLTSDAYANFFFLQSSSFTVATGGLPLNNEWAVVEFAAEDMHTTGAPVLSAITGAKLHLTDGNQVCTFHFGALWLVPPAVEGMVSLTFDDGYKEHITIAQPKLSSYGYRGTIFPILDQTINGNVNNLTPDQLVNLNHVDGWEVGPHAFTLANHTAGFPAIGPAAVEQDIISSLQYLRSLGIQFGTDVFAWPAGLYDMASLQVARRYFKIGRTTNFGNGTGCAESRYPPEPMKVKARTVVAETAATINTLIDTAATNKEWLILVWHQINASGQQTTANFNAVIDHINSNGIKVRTIGEALGLA